MLIRDDVAVLGDDRAAAGGAALGLGAPSKEVVTTEMLTRAGKTLSRADWTMDRSSSLRTSGRSGGGERGLGEAGGGEEGGEKEDWGVVHGAIQEWLRWQRRGLIVRLARIELRISEGMCSATKRAKSIRSARDAMRPKGGGAKLFENWPWFEREASETDLSYLRSKRIDPYDEARLLAIVATKPNSLKGIAAFGMLMTPGVATARNPSDESVVLGSSGGLSSHGAWNPRRGCRSVRARVLPKPGQGKGTASEAVSVQPDSGNWQVGRFERCAGGRGYSAARLREAASPIGEGRPRRSRA